MIANFSNVFFHYFWEILPALAIGFFLSGLIQEFVPEKIISKHLGGKGIKPIFYTTLVGMLLPICCWGSLPIAIGLHKKGARLGPVISFLVATPATSVSALLVTWKLLGLKFTIFIFFAVILMGVIMGLIGNLFNIKPKEIIETICSECSKEKICHIHRKGFFAHVKSILKVAFVDMVKEIGPEILLGIFLAAIVDTFVPIGNLIKQYLTGAAGYAFSLIFGLLTYICSTATVPFVDALINQGMNIGAGMVMLLVGPVTSYGTILVLKKEFGLKLLMAYLFGLSALSLSLGYLFYLIY
ncbi:MAG: permease [Candidatus Omnitrophota bacterium]|nr:permease [Candidatus Omnitrophota bacterium]